MKIKKSNMKFLRDIMNKYVIQLGKTIKINEEMMKKNMVSRFDILKVIFFIVYNIACAIASI